MMKRWQKIIIVLLISSLVVGLTLVKPHAEPRGELRFVGTVIRDGVDVYEFELSNRSSEHLKYSGYEATEPSIVYQYLEKGAWKEPQGFRCGTGLSDHVLPPGASVRFIVRRPVDATERFGVFLQSPKDRLFDIVELDWLPKELRDWTIEWQWQRQHQAWLKLVTWTEALAPVPYTSAEHIVMEALEDGVVMDSANLLDEAPPMLSPGLDPFAGLAVPAPADPFAPAADGLAPAPVVSKSP